MIPSRPRRPETRDDRGLGIECGASCKAGLCCRRVGALLLCACSRTATYSRPTQTCLSPSPLFMASQCIVKMRAMYLRTQRRRVFVGGTHVMARSPLSAMRYAFLLLVSRRMHQAGCRPTRADGVTTFARRIQCAERVAGKFSPRQKGQPPREGGDPQAPRQPVNFPLISHGTFQRWRWRCLPGSSTPPPQTRHSGGWMAQHRGHDASNGIGESAAATWPRGGGHQYTLLVGSTSAHTNPLVGHISLGGGLRRSSLGPGADRRRNHSDAVARFERRSIRGVAGSLFLCEGRSD